LTGRYNDGVAPEESRFNGEPARKDHVMSWYFGGDKKEKNIQIL
jgi:hypothetical protein